VPLKLRKVILDFGICFYFSEKLTMMEKITDQDFYGRRLTPLEIHQTDVHRQRARAYELYSKDYVAGLIKYPEFEPEFAYLKKKKEDQREENRGDKD
jgi:hypothetical protein